MFDPSHRLTVHEEVALLKFRDTQRAELTGSEAHKLWDLGLVRGPEPLGTNRSLAGTYEITSPGRVVLEYVRRGYR